MKDSEEYHSSLVYVSFPHLLFNMKSGSYFLLHTSKAAFGLMLQSAQNSQGLDIKAHLELQPYLRLIPLNSLAYITRHGCTTGIILLTGLKFLLKFKIAVAWSQRKFCWEGVKSFSDRKQLVHLVVLTTWSVFSLVPFHVSLSPIDSGKFLVFNVQDFQVLIHLANQFWTLCLNRLLFCLLFLVFLNSTVSTS